MIKFKHFYRVVNDLMDRPVSLPTYVTDEDCVDAADASSAETGDEALIGSEIEVDMFVIAEPLPGRHEGKRQCEQGEERSHPDPTILVLLMEFFHPPKSGTRELFIVDAPSHQRSGFETLPEIRSRVKI